MLLDFQHFLSLSHFSFFFLFIQPSLRRSLLLSGPGNSAHQFGQRGALAQVPWGRQLVGLRVHGPSTPGQHRAVHVPVVGVRGPRQYGGSFPPGEENGGVPTGPPFSENAAVCGDPGG